jgi:hypothetical protein
MGQLSMLFDIGGMDGDERDPTRSGGSAQDKNGLETHTGFCTHRNLSTCNPYPSQPIPLWQVTG